MDILSKYFWTCVPKMLSNLFTKNECFGYTDIESFKRLKFLKSQLMYKMATPMSAMLNPLKTITLLSLDRFWSNLCQILRIVKPVVVTYILNVY